MSFKINLTRICSALLIIIGTISTMGSSYMQSTTTKYVDAALGSDSNAGTSISAPWKTVQKAVSSVQPGDTVVIRSGTYNENVVLSVSGTSSAPIKISNYPGEAPVINGGGTMALRASGTLAYYEISGITFKSTDRYTLRLGWYGEPMTDHFTLKGNTIYGANYIMGTYHLWENNTIDGTGYAGSDGDAGISDGGTSHHNTYRYNTVKNFSNYDARGIWTQGKTHNTVIEYNTVTNIKPSSGLGQCIDLDGAAQVEWEHTVRGNNVSNCGYVGIQLENVFASVVENNVIKNSGSAGVIVINYDAGVGCLTGGDSGQYGDTNGDKNCQGDITNNIIRQNIITTSTSWGWGYGGVMNWYAGGVKIWGNTITAKEGYGNGGINFQGTASQIRAGSIKGNIITQGNGPAVCLKDASTLSEETNNLYHRTNSVKPFSVGSSCDIDYTVAEFQSLTGLAKNTITGDPAFKDTTSGDLRLTTNSAAIDKGTNIGTSVDADGKTRLVGLAEDIGAYEYGSIVPTATPSATMTITATPTIPAPTENATPVPQTITATPVVTNTAAPTSLTNIAIGKAASQSSVYESAVASRAVDGNTDGWYGNNSVTHTAEENQPWWEVNLGQSYSINDINVWTRTDCCEWRLSNFYVLVSNAPFDSTNLAATLQQSGVTNYYVSGTAGRPTTVTVGRDAQYVRIQLSGTDSLSLAEVEVNGVAAISPTNTSIPSNTPVPASATPSATGVPVNPTSTYTNTPVPSSTPTATKINSSTPTATLRPSNTATTIKTATKTATKVYTATKTPTKTKTKVFTKTYTPTKTKVVTKTFTPTKTATKTSTKTYTPTSTNTFVPTNTATQMVLPTEVPTSIPAPLTVDNLAIGKPADQSSVYESADAGRAVDNNTDGVYSNGSVTHSQEENQPWWQVDLGNNHKIDNIKLWTRSDCCEWRLSNFYVFVSDVPFASTDLTTTLNQAGVSNYYVQGNAGRPTELSIGRTGRYIRVQLTGRDALSLAEVQVYGTVKPTTNLTVINSPSSTPQQLESTATNTEATNPTATPTPTLEIHPTEVIVTEQSAAEPTTVYSMEMTPTPF